MSPRRATLEKDNACYFGLTWRCAFDPPIEPDALSRALVAIGWRDASERNPLLRELRHDDGHALVIVPRTRRVQLRVSYMVPREHRPRVAARLFAAIEAALGPAFAT